MTFKPTDSFLIIESIFDDMFQTLKKRNSKLPDETLAKIEEQLNLISFIKNKTKKTKRKRKGGKRVSKKKIKVCEDEALSQSSKDPKVCVLA